MRNGRKASLGEERNVFTSAEDRGGSSLLLFVVMMSSRSMRRRSVSPALMRSEIIFISEETLASKGTRRAKVGGRPRPVKEVRSTVISGDAMMVKDVG